MPGEDQFFAHQDVVFECFHNFVAFSQWGNTLYNIMTRLGQRRRPPSQGLVHQDHDRPQPRRPRRVGVPPLQRFVMELFRTISPTPGSISALTETRPPALQRHGYVVSPHTSTSHDPTQWVNPNDFDPTRYQHAPTSADIDQARIQPNGPGPVPLPPTSFDVADGRKVAGTVDLTVFPALTR